MNIQTDFVQALHDMKLRDKGWDNLIIYAHAYLESGNFESGLTVKCLNFWGMKAFPGWTGKTFDSQTTEFAQKDGETDMYGAAHKIGESYQIIAKWKWYDNCQEALNDYFITLQAYHTNCLQVKNKYKAYYYYLEHGNEPWMMWATDPTYTQDCIACYERLYTPEFFISINEIKT